MLLVQDSARNFVNGSGLRVLNEGTVGHAGLVFSKINSKTPICNPTISLSFLCEASQDDS